MIGNTHVRYVVITPVRNEENNFPQTIKAMASQTVLPTAWVVVDDGSTDKTGVIAEEAASQHGWMSVVHRPDRGFRQPGTGVMEAFHAGLALVHDREWAFLVKLDGDLAFEPDYFEKCFARFEHDRRLGLGGGVICRRAKRGLIAERAGDPPFHVRGATKIYRKACWDQIGGLILMPGWDTIDELKANMLGWKTMTFPDLKLHQLKDTGSADGTWANWVKNGRANYITGYQPLFMLVKCMKRIFSRPYGIGAGALAWGFLNGYIRRTPRVKDGEMIRYLREQQLRKLTFRRSIWG